ncbi:Protein of unknown function [Pyronema omphalodes CBS 100304]|uniref:Uncharacterized protein n=1 Tax=Pyronema omphalodes (strain CBS 100304) TaxID=1076935 RepID=U4LNK1_PYROM|nr:Protein of unknown function [Pyronema omphalodes CBS 100304]
MKCGDIVPRYWANWASLPAWIPGIAVHRDA